MRAAGDLRVWGLRCIKFGAISFRLDGKKFKGLRVYNIEKEIICWELNTLVYR